MRWQYLRSTVEGGFWGQFQNLVRTEVVPFQWKALNDEIPDAPKSHSIENFRIAAGQVGGEYDGMVFQDSDLYKWLEAAGFLLAESTQQGGKSHPERARIDAQIEAWADEAINLIAAAQRPDGYLNTYFIVKEPDRRWKNLREAHELYCAGHLIEAGVAVHRGTGNQKILDVVRKIADHIDKHFGPEAEKVHGYPGHEEVELALIKLYRLTGEKRYLNLAKYFVDERGKSPNFFDEEQKDPAHFTVFGIRSYPYSQSHIPVRQQTEATGHAVRAMYLYIAMADLALETGDETLRQACTRLWNNTTNRRMYITGGIGASARQEAFSTDYDLPGDTAYNETCAAIGLFIFSQRMALLEDDSRYADIMERTLYNGVISGLALDGHSYFYVNPLEVVPAVCDANLTYEHVKYRRQPWYGCACCPPNIARIIASLGEYTYHINGNTLYADLFVGGQISCELGGKKVSMRLQTDYPWNGDVRFEYSGEQAEFDFAVRLPGWSHDASLSLNGKTVEPNTPLRKGYIHFERTWSPGDVLELSLPMNVELVHANPRVRDTWGKVAVQRGPLVYCLEQEDNGESLHAVQLLRTTSFTAVHLPELLGGVTLLTAEGTVLADTGVADELYSTSTQQPPVTRKKLTFVPYYAWANRSTGAMTVWVHQENVNTK